MIFNLHPDRYKFLGVDEDGRALFEDLQPEITPWVTPVACPFGKAGDLLVVQEDPNIILRIERVRAEQVQSITEEGAKAEGLQMFDKFGATEWGGVEPHPDVPNHFRWYSSPITAFRSLLTSIYSNAWKRNEWMWVIEFKRIEP
ncbi:hypothetical protein [Hymenobacter rigui]|uniref:ASCH domain-containing protein n=1 Tax=Hymenobacter rigui TaxID=334424 RepID=A0A3R9NLV9_9BACT|nr:hypothetical protein [Hymenobacter rigui]RSK50084.1 hypothetical protein EI291_05385 [Hymenobacter rigui]